MGEDVQEKLNLTEQLIFLKNTIKDIIKARQNSDCLTLECLSTIIKLIDECQEVNHKIDESDLMNIIIENDKLLLDEILNQFYSLEIRLANITSNLSKFLPRKNYDERIDIQPMIMIHIDHNCDIKNNSIDELEFQTQFWQKKPLKVKSKFAKSDLKNNSNNIKFKNLLDNHYMRLVKVNENHEKISNDKKEPIKMMTLEKFYEKFIQNKSQVYIKDLQIFKLIPELKKNIIFPLSFAWKSISMEDNQIESSIRESNLQIRYHGHEIDWYKCPENTILMQCVGWQIINLINDINFNDLRSKNPYLLNEVLENDNKYKNDYETTISRQVLMRILKDQRQVDYIGVMLVEDDLLYVPQGYWMSSKSMNRCMTLEFMLK